MSEEKNSLIKAKSRGLEAVINYYFQTKTPKEFIKVRPGAGGQSFKYVTVGYVVSQLNIAFGFNWEWKILETHVGKEQIWLRGELTLKQRMEGGNDFTITRSGVGGAIIKKSRTSGEPLSIANDVKSADSDALKVAAAKFGVGADVKFKEMDILDEMPEVVDEEQGMNDSIRDMVMKKYFATAAERGFNGEQAKEKIKAYFAVAHMEELTTQQLQKGIELMETKYPLSSKTSESEEKIEDVTIDGEITEDIEEVKPLCLYDKCDKGPSGTKAERDGDSLFCSKDCRERYENDPPEAARPRLAD